MHVAVAASGAVPVTLLARVLALFGRRPAQVPADVRWARRAGVPCRELTAEELRAEQTGEPRASVWDAMAARRGWRFLRRS